LERRLGLPQLHVVAGGVEGRICEVAETANLWNLLAAPQLTRETEGRVNLLDQSAFELLNASRFLILE
jgi:hypothetical protein